MTQLSREGKVVELGPGLPTVIIGERINPTGKKKLAAALQAGDYAYVQREAVRQVEAGAHVVDVNVGVPGIDEPRVLREAVLAVMDAVDVPLSIDSADPEALAAALSVYKGKALVNSVTGEDRILARVLPLVREYGAAVIGLCLNDLGIPPNPAERLEIARKIVGEAEKYGVPREDLLIDCLAMTVGADHTAAATTLGAIRQVTGEFGVSTCLGASNVSYGLPDRVGINAIFLGMAVGAGLTSAIVDPTVPEIPKAIITADLLAGKDEWAMRYIAYYRSQLKKEQSAT
ncbi:MAG: dihydropteroate synthase [Chloroflexi bacterium]|nr:dihydropteroate synthase [Chloroflexota bacterium]